MIDRFQIVYTICTNNENPRVIFSKPLAKEECDKVVASFHLTHSYYEFVNEHNCRVFIPSTLKKITYLTIKPIDG